MTPARFTEIGQLIFGSAWIEPLANALDVAPRTIRRWRNGENPMPLGLAEDLERLCRNHAAKLIKAADEIGAQRSGGPS